MATVGEKPKGLAIVVELPFIIYTYILHCAFRRSSERNMFQVAKLANPHESMLQSVQCPKKIVCCNLISFVPSWFTLGYRVGRSKLCTYFPLPMPSQ